MDFLPYISWISPQEDEEEEYEAVEEEWSEYECDFMKRDTQSSDSEVQSTESIWLKGRSNVQQIYYQCARVFLGFNGSNSTFLYLLTGRTEVFHQITVSPLKTACLGRCVVNLRRSCAGLQNIWDEGMKIQSNL